MKKVYDDRQKNEMRERLKKIAHKNLTTTMIFALAEFERAFGDWFGYGEDEEGLTDFQKENKEKWAECRENILNNGNKQLRLLKDEIDNHEVVWLRYTTHFIPVEILKQQQRKDKENNGNN